MAGDGERPLHLRTLSSGEADAPTDQRRWYAFPHGWTCTTGIAHGNPLTRPVPGIGCHPFSRNGDTNSTGDRTSARRSPAVPLLPPEAMCSVRGADAAPRRCPILRSPRRALALRPGGREKAVGLAETFASWRSIRFSPRPGLQPWAFSPLRPNPPVGKVLMGGLRSPPSSSGRAAARDLRALIRIPVARSRLVPAMRPWAVRTPTGL